MILRTLALVLSLTACAAAQAQAQTQERVTVGTQRTTANGALFLAAARGYFKAEGLTIEMQAYATAQAAAEALAAGSNDFAVADFTAAAFQLAGKGAIKAIAAQLRENRSYEGNELIASNVAYGKGLRKYEDIANKVVGLDRLGTSFHYQLGQLARVKRFDFAGVTLKPLQSFDAVAAAVREGRVDAAILPSQYARELLVASQAKLIGWVSEIDEPQLGALFASSRMIAEKRDTVARFVRAYARGVADYAAALLRKDRYGKRVFDAKTRAAATAIAYYVYPGSAGGAGVVEANVYFMDPRARLDAADIARQVAWYKAQGLIDKTVEPRNVLDLSFTAAR
jgi:NitT/TauT family transport system substrate-binding protein